MNGTGVTVIEGTTIWTAAIGAPAYILPIDGFQHVVLKVLQGIIIDALVRYVHHSFAMGVAASLMDTLAPGVTADTVTERPIPDGFTNPIGGLAAVIARAWLMDHPMMAPEPFDGSLAAPTFPMAHRVEPVKQGVGQAGVTVAVVPYTAVNAYPIQVPFVVKPAVVMSDPGVPTTVLPPLAPVMMMLPPEPVMTVLPPEPDVDAPPDAPVMIVLPPVPDVDAPPDAPVMIVLPPVEMTVNPPELFPLPV